MAALRTIKAGLFRQDVCELGEGPFWHEGQLWWVDIERGQLFSADEHGTRTSDVAFGQRIGMAVPTGRQTMLVALTRELAHLDLKDKSWKILSRPADMPEENRFNDGKCDPAGRLLVGTLSLKGTQKTSSLYSLQKDSTLRSLRKELSISNGLAWTEDGRTLYFIDTPSGRVFAYDYDLPTGTISRERVILKFSGDDGHPDGMTIDREGRLWIGFWDGWSVRCYRPQTGECEVRVELPCARGTSCCFGGPELNRLFITTARVGLSDADLRKQPLAGSIFVCEPGTAGYPTSLAKI